MTIHFGQMKKLLVLAFVASGANIYECHISFSLCFLGDIIEKTLMKRKSFLLQLFISHLDQKRKEAKERSSKAVLFSGWMITLGRPNLRYWGQRTCWGGGGVVRGARPRPWLGEQQWVDSRLPSLKSFMLFSKPRSGQIRRDLNLPSESLFSLMKDLWFINNATWG